MKAALKRWFASEEFTVLLALLALLTFAVSESLYEMLALNQVFLVLRLQSNLQLLEIVFLFNLLPALLLFAGWLFLRRLHGGFARVFLGLSYFLVALFFFFQAHNLYTSDWWQSLHLSWIAWVIPAGLIALFPFRYPKAFRSFILALSPIILLFPGLFLFRTWTDPADLGQEDSTLAHQPAPVRMERADLPPVILVVFDELALNAVLDDSGQIDAARYPNFRWLSQHSHWFRNATSNADYTYQSLPTILTANFPLRGGPSYHVYPDNLFNLLYPFYDIYAYESWTRFCIPRRFHCMSATREDVGGHLELLRDIVFLFAARIIPKGVDVGLPDMRRTWGPFHDAPTLVTSRLERFEKFMDTLPEVAPKKRFFLFFHHLLPHSPYLLHPDGSLFVVRPYDFQADFADDRPLLRDLLERYREQIQHADRELGRMIESMKQLGLYDRTLLIVVADHGVSYRPDAPGRDLLEVNGRIANADLLLTIPYFIKLPHQTEGVFHTNDAQLVDIIPTLGDLLDIRVPWENVGRSVFAQNPPPRLKVAYSRFMKRYEFPDTLGLTRLPVDLGQAPAAASPLLGQAVADCDVEPTQTIAGAVDNWGVMNAGQAGAHLVANGWAVNAAAKSIPEAVAVAVNGEILAVTAPRYDRGDIADRFEDPYTRKSGWYVSIPLGGRQVESLQAFVVVDAARLRLAPLTNAARAQR